MTLPPPCPVYDPAAPCPAYDPAPRFQFTGMKPLPANVHLLTLEMYKPDRLLLRLEHQFETSEDPELSLPVDVNLQVGVLGWGGGCVLTCLG